MRNLSGYLCTLAPVAPNDASDKSVTWLSSDNAVATVSSDGKVTAVKAGTATITVTTEDGGKTAICKVTVLANIDGALSGLFSVSDTKKVRFSKGNLWADGSNALHFEANQYAFNSYYESSHVSLFTWSSTVADAVGGSNSGDNLFCDESHKVSVDGGDAIYYALSKDEWTYLFNNHTKKWASVNGVNGYVIAPDGFTGELASSYADDAALAADDLVFLPAAGSRYGSYIYGVGGYGYYWSSTAYLSFRACYVYFSSSSVTVTPDNYDGRNFGYSVRLITDVK